VHWTPDLIGKSIADMSGRKIRLGPGECPDVETGARYFAALAFPGAGENPAREDAERGWVGAYLHEANRIDDSSDPFEDERLNAFVQLPPKWCNAQVRTTRRRLRDRSDAARALRPWVQELLSEPRSPLSGVRKFTQRQIALYLCNGDPEQAANFQKRVWRPSRPVLHLAIAYDRLLCALEEDRTDYPVDLASSMLVGELIAIADKVKQLIIMDHRIGVSEENLLQLEWVP